MKFDGLEPRCCEDIKAIVAPEIGLKRFGVEIWCGMCPPYFLRFSPKVACTGLPINNMDHFKTGPFKCLDKYLNK